MMISMLVNFKYDQLLTFENDMDQASYQIDPDHLAFVAECSYLWSKIIVYDSINALPII